MNAFTRELLDLAYRTCQTRRGTRLSVANVRRQMERHWRNYREGTIAMWATRIAGSVSHPCLATKFDVVFDLLVQAGVYYWEWPGDDEVERAWATAWGLATLRWLNRERAGRAPAPPECADDEIAAWLAGQQTRQLPLWASSTT